MTHEQIEKLLALLDNINTSLITLAECTEKLTDCFEQATYEDDNGKCYIRMAEDND
jgi:hypothetical protein